MNKKKQERRKISKIQALGIYRRKNKVFSVKKLKEKKGNPLNQSYSTELHVMMKMFFTSQSNMAATSHTWLLST